MNRVAKPEVGEKVVVCGCAVRWGNDEIKAIIEQRTEDGVVQEVRMSCVLGCRRR